MKILAAALALTLATGTASAATIGDRLLDAKDALNRADTAATALDAARKVVTYRKTILALPGLCEKARKIDHDEPMNNDFPLFSCCSTLGEGGLGALVGMGGLSLPWLGGTGGMKLTRMQEFAIEEVRDQIEDRAGKAEIQEELMTVAGTLANACRAAAAPYIED